MTRRLLLSYLTLTAFVLLVLEIPLGVSFARVQEARLSSAVARDAVVLAGFADDALNDGGGERLRSLTHDYAGRSGGHVIVVDQAGDLLVDTDPAQPGPRQAADSPEVTRALEGEIAEGIRATSQEPRRFSVAVPIGTEGDVRGAVWVTFPTDVLDARVRRAWLTLILVGLVVLVAAGFASLLLARSVVRPIRGLEDAAARVGEGDTRARAPDEGPREVRALSSQFNAMTSRIDELLWSQRSFVADASHQLRTPLTALRLRLENLEEVIAPEALGELELAVDEASRLGRLVDGLLALARAEGARPDVEHKDLAEALLERQMIWEPLAEEQDVTLATDLVIAPLASAVPGAVEQILDNLIANATKVAPPGSTITLRLRHAGSWVCLSVIDQGPGMSAEQRASAFDRFWRAESGDDPDGFGLGLPIVRQLAISSGGEAGLLEAPGGGLEVVVWLPPAAEAGTAAVHEPEPPAVLLPTPRQRG